MTHQVGNFYYDTKRQALLVMLSTELIRHGHYQYFCCHTIVEPIDQPLDGIERPFHALSLEKQERITQFILELKNHPQKGFLEISRTFGRLFQETSHLQPRVYYGEEGYLVHIKNTKELMHTLLYKVGYLSPKDDRDITQLFNTIHQKVMFTSVPTDSPL